MKYLWRRIQSFLDEVDLLEYLIGAILASGIEGLVFWAGGYPANQVLACVIFALAGGMFICCIIEILFFDHK
jgi:hypothetical protein